MQVDRGQNVRDFRGCDIELGQQFDLAAGNAHINMQLSRYRDEIFLQHLQRYNSGSRSPVLSDKV